MGKRIGVIGGLLAAIGVVAFVVVQSPADPAGQATGSDQKAQAVWQKMASYEKTHLRAWKGAFAQPAPSPTDVLEAFNEVGYAITAPGGFWRKTVPDRWLGCQVNAELPPCERIKGMESEFKRLDAMQERIANLSESGARRYLARNHKKMIAYLDTYVPERLSASAMKQTGLYATKLKDVMEDGATAFGDDSL